MSEYSYEQELIIKSSQNDYNIIVDSTAGSGKTTTCLGIAKHNIDSNILLVTFNRSLRKETKDKAKLLNINNLEIHTYHSFGYKYYDNTCSNDNVLRNILNEKKQILHKIQYDIIIIDEAQDMINLFFEEICKIYKDNSVKAKFIIVGDVLQNIFKFKKSDSRFIQYASSIFNFSNLIFKKFTLSYTFRLNYEHCDFINKCMLKKTKIKSKKNGLKPKYTICNIYQDKPFNDLLYILDQGYKPEDIFIVAYSIKSDLSPIRKFENKIKTKRPDILVYAPLSDEEVLDTDVISNKLVFTTIHQIKGRERKIVFYFGFDSSYFYYSKDENKYQCPNELFVAMTRCIDRTYIYHDYKHEYLPFLNQDILEECTDFNKTEMGTKLLKDSSKPLTVTNFLKYLPEDIINKSMKKINILHITQPSNRIDIPNKIYQTYNCEIVSEINGIAIPAFFQYKLQGKSSLFKFKLSKNFTIEDMLEKCNYYNSRAKKLIFKPLQIDRYNWISQENLNKCINNLNSLGINKTASFEISIECNLFNTRFIGEVDCINKDSVYEFKCVDSIQNEHILQLLSYMYILHSNNLHNNSNFYIYNIYNNHKIKISCDNYDILKGIIEDIFIEKNKTIKLDSDEIFFNDINQIKHSYF